MTTPPRTSARNSWRERASRSGFMAAHSILTFRDLPDAERNGTMRSCAPFGLRAHPITAMTSNQSLFFKKVGITPGDLQRYLREALSAVCEYADLYFEYLTSTSISVDESMVKSATQGISAGCGVRVLAGERTGYAYTDDLAPEKILRA